MPQRDVTKAAKGGLAARQWPDQACGSPCSHQALTRGLMRTQGADENTRLPTPPANQAQGQRTGGGRRSAPSSPPGSLAVSSIARVLPNLRGGGVWGA